VRPFSKLARSTSREPVNGVVLEVWERGTSSKLACSTSRESVNRVVLEVWERDPFSKIEY
jgi:hypothetical protein